jgi:multidrug efflux pump subunit AcrB
MWIVRLSLVRPRMVIVMSILIFIIGVLNIIRMPKDIFPSINLPVIAVIWSYPGLAPEEMDRRVVRQSESQITTTVSGIEHIESQALSGSGIVKVYFHPGTPISQAMTQINSTSQSVIRSMPPGITPPSIIQYDAADVPIVELAMSSETVPITQIADIAETTVLPQLTTVPGASPSPATGGADRLINVDLDPQAMTSRGVTAQDLTNAIGNQNLILPAGDAKMGVRDYFVRLNNNPTAVETFNNLPVKLVHGSTVYVRDVAHVRDGNAVQVSMVRVNGEAAVLLTILKNGGASTIDVVNRIKARLPQIKGLLPADVKLDLLLDQSIFVNDAVTEVVREAVIAACLTGLMILLFLGSWRSTVIVAISIPLSILTSIAALGAIGHTLNTLTLGGMALAVGMLVDDATVAVENTSRDLSEGMDLRQAILHSAEQVALPALTSTLSICIVFVPVAFLSGVAQSLFLPLALSVVFAMIPSYILSRTLVTTMLDYLLVHELDLYRPSRPGEPSPSKHGIIWRVHEAFEHWFESARDVYAHAVEWALHHRLISGGLLALFFALSAVFLLPVIGQDFFPNVDSGQIRLHVRVPAGTRLEETGATFLKIEDSIREMIPANERTLILDNIGLESGTNFVRSNTGTISSADGEIDVSLAEKHHSTWDYQTRLRKQLQSRFPDCTFFYQPADISTQVLDFGTSAPMDIQVLGPYQNTDADYKLALDIQKKVKGVSGVVDSYIYQVQNAPELRVNVDRTRAMQVGLTQQDVAGNVLISLASSSLLSPSYFLDPSTGFQYVVSTQTPQYKVDSVESLLATPVSSGTVLATQTASQSASAIAPQPSQTIPELLNNLATVTRDTTPVVVTEYNILPAYDVFASVENRDLGGAVSDIQKILNKAQQAALKDPKLKGTSVTMNGQAATMQSSFSDLGLGLIFAIVLIYLLLTVNFESWIDPLVILMAAPGALSGVLWGLFITKSTFNVPSLMGTIMSIGVATANSILLVTFANEQREMGKNALDAALAACFTRFRPVIMTALAMIIGMLPMALGLGTGGQQNAPLGRAVIGGLTVATFTTLVFVPIMYTVFRRKQPAPAQQTEGEPVPPVSPNRTGAGENPAS